MNESIDKLNQSIAGVKAEIVQHPLYSNIQTINDIHIFMQHHVYAVWDFMSLLKSLQNQLTCTEVPWFPVGTAETRFLINEIVVGEESDQDQEGNYTSHFELYFKAMKQCGASTDKMSRFIETLKDTKSIETAYNIAETPESVRKFVDFTFEMIRSGNPAWMAAVFTFGREDLIPSMFLSLVTDLNSRFENQLSVFKYYLDRHIEIDGGHHSHLALKMTEQLVGQDTQSWKKITEIVHYSLECRRELWNGVLKQIQLNRLNKKPEILTTHLHHN